ncbi:proteinase T-like protein, partial [Dinothrombium tinctorium]
PLCQISAKKFDSLSDSESAPLYNTSGIHTGNYFVVFKPINYKCIYEHLLNFKKGIKFLKYIFDRDTWKGYLASLSSDALEAVRRDKRVEYVESEAFATAFDTFDATDYECEDSAKENCEICSEIHETKNWALERISHKNEFLNKGYRYAGPQIETDAVANDIFICVIDTGVRITHEEVKGRAEWGKNFVCTEKREDLNGHGTAVSSVAMGKTAGVAKEANVIAVKVLDQFGRGSYGTVIKGINYCVDQAKSKKVIINMSLGGPKSKTVDMAVEEAYNKNIPIIVAAGNEYENVENVSPARANGAFAVAACNRNNSFAKYSNYGEKIKIIAPGTNVYCAHAKSNTAMTALSGTSLAAPVVSGIFAQLISSQSDQIKVDKLYASVLQNANKNVLKEVPASTGNLLAYNGCCPE